MSGQIATVLRFEKDVDPAQTKLLGWEGRFEPLVVGGKTVVIVPIRNLDRDEVVPLLITLVDGTEFPFIVKPKSFEEWGWTDHQVNVFKSPDSYKAVLASLNDSLKRERDLREKVERFKEEENSVDHAYATLLANGQVKKTPFSRRLVYRPKNEDMDIVVEVFSGPGKAAAIVTLTNTYYGDDWKFERAYLTRDFTSFTVRPFALRMDRATLVPGQTGTIAVVVDQSAFETKNGDVTDLALQIFRGDGLIQVAVALEASLIRR
ncbi:hypothetical protein DB31_7782 [Hyalangium minutum]|uniref:DUF2381 family protein n=1 Tax=Hyalangium minutum TaxID=394096 RepID=A0A085WLI2_9BACT|nr:hypothetical protein DB31_7782 [Hyalangium minutum]